MATTGDGIVRRSCHTWDTWVITLWNAYTFYVVAAKSVDYWLSGSSKALVMLWLWVAVDSRSLVLVVFAFEMVYVAAALMAFIVPRQVCWYYILVLTVLTGSSFIPGLLISPIGWEGPFFFTIHPAAALLAAIGGFLLLALWVYWLRKHRGVWLEGSGLSCTDAAALSALGEEVSCAVSDVMQLSKRILVCDRQTRKSLRIAIAFVALLVIGTSIRIGERVYRANRQVQRESDLLLVAGSTILDMQRSGNATQLFSDLNVVQTIGAEADKTGSVSLCTGLIPLPLAEYGERAGDATPVQVVAFCSTGTFAMKGTLAYVVSDGRARVVNMFSKEGVAESGVLDGGWFFFTAKRLWYCAQHNREIALKRLKERIDPCEVFVGRTSDGSVALSGAQLLAMAEALEAGFLAKGVTE